MFIPRRRVLARIDILGLKQGTFAKIIGMQHSGFSRSFHAEHPRIVTMARIAHGLGWTVDEMLGDSDEIVTRAHPYESVEKYASLVRSDHARDALQAWFLKTWPAILISIEHDSLLAERVRERVS